MGKNQFVVKHGTDWAVRGAGNVKATRIVSTQREAIGIARQIRIIQKKISFCSGNIYYIFRKKLKRVRVYIIP